MSALLADHSPMHSSSHYTHFSLLQQPPHASSPSSPTGFDSSCCPSVVGPDNNDYCPPPDLSCTLRFGDIPASALSANARAVGLMQSSASTMQLLGNSLCPSDIRAGSSKAEVKLLNRSQSQLSKQSGSPIAAIGKELEALGNDEVAVTISTQANSPCYPGATGLCSSTNCGGSPGFPESLLGLRKFLPSNNLADDEDEDEEIWAGTDSWPALDIYSCDDFRMYEFKVRKCVRGRSHDWTECPFAHPGEKARRRDPRRYHYSGTACPDFRKGNCRRGEACEYSHGVFECWLHPTRYRTQPCKDGKGCRRRVCFFAHTPEQLRVVPAEGESPPTTPGSGSSSGGSARSSLLKAAALSGGAYDGSPLRRALAGTLDGSVALELFLDDTSNKSTPVGGCHHHHHHHWIGMESSPSSTLVGLSAGATSPSPMSSPALSPASPHVNSGTPGHRRHLDRLHSIPTLSIPAADDANDSPPHGSPSSTMAELMSTLQTLQVSPAAMGAQSCRAIPAVASGAWPLLSQQLHQAQQQSQSAPNSLKTRYAHVMQMNPTGGPVSSPYASVKPVGMVVGPAGVAGNSGVATAGELQAVAESDIPDLGWVNELVQ